MITNMYTITVWDVQQERMDCGGSTMTLMASTLGGFSLTNWYNKNSNMICQVDLILLLYRQTNFIVIVKL